MINKPFWWPINPYSDKKKSNEYNKHVGWERASREILDNFIEQTDPYVHRYIKELEKQLEHFSPSLYENIREKYFPNKA